MIPDSAIFHDIHWVFIYYSSKVGTAAKSLVPAIA